MLIITFFSIICSLFSGVGFALEQDEAVVELIWSSETLYPGSNATITVFFISRCSEELAISRLGFHFDWMPTNVFATLNMSDNPVIIPANGTHVFNPVMILIPEDVSVGTHSYFVAVEGFQGDSYIFSWEDSYPRTLSIQDSGEETPNEGGEANDQQDQLLIIIGIILVVAVTVLIMILMFKRKKKIKRARRHKLLLESKQT